MNFPYSDKPIVLRGLFDSSSHAQIKNFTETLAPFLNPKSDLDAPESPRKFNRRSLHNTPFLTEIHHQLTDFACKVFGVAVKPSYSFLSMYELGGKCFLHVDREQCRYTIDYLISQDQPDQWPITISNCQSTAQIDAVGFRAADTDDKIQTVLSSNTWTECLLNPNDAVCYSGTNAWHYRPTKSSGKVNLAFFHFVEETWDGTLD